MIDITQEQRDQRYKESTEYIQDVYSNEATGKILRTIYKNKNLPEDENLYTAFCYIAGDIILGFYKITDVPQLIQVRLKLDPATAGTLNTALQTALTNFHLETVPNSAAQNPVKIQTPQQQPPPTTPIPAQTTPPIPTVIVPSYQKPLMGVPRYQNEPPKPPTNNTSLPPHA